MQPVILAASSSAWTDYWMKCFQESFQMCHSPLHPMAVSPPYCSEDAVAAEAPTNVTSHFWMQHIIMTLWLKWSLNSWAPSGVSGFRALGLLQPRTEQWEGVTQGQLPYSLSSKSGKSSPGKAATRCAGLWNKGKRFSATQDPKSSDFTQKGNEEILDKGKQGKNERRKTTF